MLCLKKNWNLDEAGPNELLVIWMHFLFRKKSLTLNCEHSDEKALCIGKNKWLLSIMLFFALGLTASNGLAEKSAFADLELFSNECIRTSDPSVCKRALARSEVLQRQAAEQGNYACQSRLLGLGADLLMISFGTSRDESIRAIMKEMKNFC